MRSMSAVQTKSGDPRTPNREHRLGLWRKGLSGTAAALLALMFLGGCASPFSRASSANEHACSDKFVKELVTNTKVDGLWNCLSADLQNKLHMFGVEGDDVFTTPGQSAPTVVSQTYVGRAGGVDTYVVVVRPDNTAVLTTFVIAVWTDAQNKITNLDVTSGAF